MCVCVCVCVLILKIIKMSSINYFKDIAYTQTHQYIPVDVDTNI